MDFAASPFSIKSLNDSGHIEGLLAGFGNVDHGGDKLLAGCLTKSLALRGGNPLPMLLCHDLRRPIGAWKTWTEAAEGLHVEGKISLGTRDGQEAYALANDGALTGLSIGWQPKSHSTNPRTGVREVAEADLMEGSLVPVPMNDKTRVRSIKTIASVRDLEDLLAESGMSGRKAKTAASAAWKAINEAPDEDAAARAELEAIFASSSKRLEGKNRRYHTRGN
jgi:HK97 family phage prohead protease